MAQAAPLSPERCVRGGGAVAATGVRADSHELAARALRSIISLKLEQHLPIPVPCQQEDGVRRIHRAHGSRFSCHICHICRCSIRGCMRHQRPFLASPRCTGAGVRPRKRLRLRRGRGSAVGAHEAPRGTAEVITPSHFAFLRAALHTVFAVMTGLRRRV